MHETDTRYPATAADSDWGGSDDPTEHVPAAIVRFDARRRLTRANAAFVRLLGVPRVELTGRPLSETPLPPGDQQSLRQALDAVFATGSEQRLRMDLHTDAGPRWLDVRIAPEPAASGPGGAVALFQDVTEYMVGEPVCGDTDASLRAVSEASLAGVYLIQDGLYQYVNDTLADILGYAPEEMVGRLGPADVVLAEHLEQVLANLDARLRGESGEPSEIRCVSATGEVKDMLVWSAPTLYRGRSAAVGTVVDITESKSAEDHRREREKGLEFVAAQLPCMVWATDSALLLRYIKGGGLNDVSRDLSSEAGRTVDEIFAGEPGGERLISAHRRALAGEPQALDLRYGDRVYALRLEASHDQAQEVNGVIGLAVDITARKDAEDELRRLQADLAHISRVTVLDGMATGIAHELNQPLSAIVMYAEGCQAALGNAVAGEGTTAGDLLRRISAEGERAGAIIQRLRRLLRRAPPDCHPVDLNRLVRESVAFFSREIWEQRIRLHLELERQLPEVMADGVQIQQVIINLVRNAVDVLRTQPGERHIIITSASGPGRVTLAVADSGPGVGADDLDRLTDPMFTTREAGLGFGLAICRTIIEAHNGELHLPRAGPKPRFAFTLPGSGSRHAREEDG